MAAPVYVGSNAGTVATGASSTFQKTGCTSGNIIVLQVMADGTAGVTKLANDAVSLVTLDASSAAMDLIGTSGGQNVGSPTAALQGLWIGRATGSTVTTMTVGAGGDDMYAQVHEFSGVNTGTVLADVIENSSAGSSVNGVGSVAQIDDTGVATLGADRLALNCIGVNDDNALGSFTGESGGDWTLVASFASATGTDGAVGLQAATIAATGTINGGSFTMAAADPWGVVGFALIPVPSAEIFGTKERFYLQAVNRASVW